MEAYEIEYVAAQAFRARLIPRMFVLSLRCSELSWSWTVLETDRRRCRWPVRSSCWFVRTELQARPPQVLTRIAGRITRRILAIAYHIVITV